MPSSLQVHTILSGVEKPCALAGSFLGHGEREGWQRRIFLLTNEHALAGEDQASSSPLSPPRANTDRPTKITEEPSSTKDSFDLRSH